MQAITFETFGPSAVLKQAEVAAPIPGPGEVLIKITHTSVNPVDWKIREGYLHDMLPHRFPIIPGWDAAGEVLALGEGVKTFRSGDEVFAYARLPEVHAGTYAEMIALPVSQVAKKPRSLELAQAAAVPLVALTAYQALHEVVHVAAGDKVLVIGGAGGVGSFAIQIARLAGAEVSATASPGNLPYLRKLGASHALDYTKGEMAAVAQQIAPQGFDIIFDAVGGKALSEASALASPLARIVSIVEAPKVGHFHFVYPSGSQLAEIAKLFDAGKLMPPAIQVRSIKEAAAAQDENAQRHVRGKVILTIDF